MRDTRGGSCVTWPTKSYDADKDVFLGNELLFSSSCDFVGGANVAAISDACILRFTALPDNS